MKEEKHSEFRDKVYRNLALAKMIVKDIYFHRDKYEINLCEKAIDKLESFLNSIRLRKMDHNTYNSFKRNSPSGLTTIIYHQVAGIPLQKLATKPLPYPLDRPLLNGV